MFDVIPPRPPWLPEEPTVANKPIPGSRTKAYAIMATAFLAMSYFAATLAVSHAADPMSIWYTMFSVGSGLFGSFMAVVTVVHHFNWE